MLWIPEANGVIPISKGKDETLAKKWGNCADKQSMLCSFHEMRNSQYSLHFLTLFRRYISLAMPQRRARAAMVYRRKCEFLEERQ